MDIIKTTNLFVKEIINVEVILNEVKTKYDVSNLEAIPSIIVFLAEYENCKLISDKIPVSNAIYKYVSNLVDHLNNKKIVDHTLVSGITGILYSLTVLSLHREEYSNLTNDIKNIFISITKNYLELISNKSFIKEEMYDLINGLSGNLSLLLAYYPDEKELISDLLDYFIKLFNDCDKNSEKIIITYQNIPNQFLKKDFPEGYVNLGVAHGLSMPLLLLTMAYISGYNNKNILETINSLINTFWNYSYSYKDNLFFDGLYTKNRKYTPNKRNGWCYGDFFIKSILLYSCKTVNDYRSIILKKSIVKYLNTNISDFNLFSPTFCHGYSGLLFATQFTKQVGLQSEVPFILEEQIIKNIERLHSSNLKYQFRNFEYEISENEVKNLIIEEDNIGILSGTTGVLLPLLSYYDPTVIEWKKIFLGGNP